MESQNPLKKHFRRPSVYFKLPSRGKFWAEEDLVLGATGEISVYPMTSADEITLKTPDGLMNGASVVDVIQSCCPEIKNAWKMPSTDVDALLVAIRIASYGTDMDLGTTCPHCGEKNDYTFNLSAILDTIKCPDYETPVRYDDLEIKLTPLNYAKLTNTNVKAYEEQRILEALQNSTLSDDERNAQVKASVERIMEANEETLLESTEYIKTADGDIIQDKIFIKEYYENASGKAVKEVRARLEQIAQAGKLPDSTINCNECHKDFTVPLVFDYSSFFDLSS